MFRITKATSSTALQGRRSLTNLTQSTLLPPSSSSFHIQPPKRSFSVLLNKLPGDQSNPTSRNNPSIINPIYNHPHISPSAAYGTSSYGRRLPVNTVVKFVPQQEAWIIERLGKFSRILDPGLAILIPIIEEIKYVHSLKEAAIEIPHQSAITQDNVTLNLDGVLYLRVVDPFKASYGVEDPEYAVSQLAQTTMRSEIGKIPLDSVFKERDSLNHNIVNAINSASSEWGIQCLRYEIRDLELPDKVVESMQLQVAAERKKRAFILESEGQRSSMINIAEGDKQARILASEGQKMEQINTATGEAEAILRKAKATAEGLNHISESLKRENGSSAVSFTIAEQYLAAFGNIAKEGNTMLLPSEVNNPANMMAQALGVYGVVQKAGAKEMQKTGRRSDDGNGDGGNVVYTSSSSVPDNNNNDPLGDDGDDNDDGYNNRK